MNVFDLVAKITLDDDEYEKKLDNSEKKTKSFGDRLKAGLGAAGKVGAAAFGAATAAVGAASVAVGKMVQQSISAYADYEQLVGGIQKLYGNMGQSLEEYAAAAGKPVEEVRDEWGKLETAQNMVLDNAKNAYKTAGMSANEYMETATSFSAALINSLGGDTVAAAAQTDVAMRSISDNFNTFGGDIESVQNAYQGFAKGQFNMLDNLKLGYGGTKTEMERLIKDANEYAAANGQAADLSIDSFSDIVTAIDLVQQKQNIAGTTAREAGSTIAGSFGMLKGAWSNLITGFTDSEADIGELINNVVESAETVLENLLPAAEQALSGIGQLVEQIAPIISEKLPGLVETILPPLLNAATSLVIGIVQALPTIVTVLVEQGPMIINSLIQAIMTMIPVLIQTGLQLVQNLTSGMDPQQLVQKGIELLTNLIASIAPYLPQMVIQGVQLITQLAVGLIRAIPQVIAAIPQIIQTIKSPFDGYDWGSIGMNLIRGIGRGIADAASSLAQMALNAVKAAWDSMTGFLKINSPSKRAHDIIGKNWALGIGEGFVDEMPTDDMVGAVEDTFNQMAGMPELSFDTNYQTIKGGSDGGAFAPVINVYGAAGQDVNELANIVMDKLSLAYRRKKVSYAY